MTVKNEKEIKKIAQDHWEYSKGILERTTRSELTDEDVVELCGYFYTKALVHGYKHGVDDS